MYLREHFRHFIIIICSFISLNTPAQTPVSIIELAWEKVPLAKSYNIRIKTINDRLILEKKSQESIAKIQIPPGRYQFQISANDYLGRQGLWSAPSLIDVRPEAPKPLPQKDTPIYARAGKVKKINLRWESFHQETSFFLQVWKNEDIIFTGDITTNNHDIEFPGPGDYSFAVHSKINGVTSEDSEREYITIIERPDLSPITIISPKENIRFSSPMSYFNWTPIKKINSYFVEITKKENDQASIILNAQFKTTSFIKFLEDGDYSLKVCPIDEFGIDEQCAIHNFSMLRKRFSNLLTLAANYSFGSITNTSQNDFKKNDHSSLNMTEFQIDSNFWKYLGAGISIKKGSLNYNRVDSTTFEAEFNEQYAYLSLINLYKTKRFLHTPRLDLGLYSQEFSPPETPFSLIAHKVSGLCLNLNWNIIFNEKYQLQLSYKFAPKLTLTETPIKISEEASSSLSELKINFSYQPFKQNILLNIGYSRQSLSSTYSGNLNFLQSESSVKQQLNSLYLGLTYFIN